MDVSVHPMRNGGQVLPLDQPHSLEHCWNLIASVPFDKMYRPPLVSVVITAHNYARYLADTIQSVSAQTYTEFECIIVDDASSDNTREVVKTILGSMEETRFSMISLPANLG